MSDAARTTTDGPVQNGSPSQGEPTAKSTMSRIKLALLEQYALQAEQAGSDPYNTTSGSVKDQWRGNARRI